MAHAALPHLLRAAEDSPRKVADLVNISSVAGRVAREGSGVYNLTKFGVGAFSESLRQEVTRRTSASRSWSRARWRRSSSATTAGDPGGGEAALRRDGELRSEDIADAIAYLVTRPRHVAVNEILIRPTEQQP